MDETQLKNGVLIYLAVADKTFVICGDQGINDIVANDFGIALKISWLFILKTETLARFNRRNFEGGEELKKHFPWSEDDSNELSNEISKG
jgi:uncharacterized membrane protein